MRLLSTLFSVVLGAELVACGHGETVAPPRPPGPPKLSITSGTNASDTIDVTLATPVTALVQRDGVGLSGVTVNFATHPANGAQSGLRVAAPQLETFDTLASSVTASDGAVSARVRLGTQAGRAYVVVSAPSFGLIDSALIVVRPGHGVKATIEPADTAGFAGGSIKYRISAPDRAGNPTTDWRFGFSTGVSAAANGDSTVHLGSDPVRTQFFVGSIWTGVGAGVQLTVVPRDSMGFHHVGWNSSAQQYVSSLVTMRSDGSNVRMFDSTVVQGSRWLPDGRLVFDLFGDIYVEPAGGPWTLLVPKSLSGAVQCFAPSRAGDWIYYAAGDVTNESLWRVRPDGSARELLVPPTDRFYPYGMDVLPDGSGLLVISALNGTVYRVDVATRALRTLPITATSLKISPKGDLFAYTQMSPDAVHVANLDGSNVRQIARWPLPFEFQLNWSSDGQFLLLATVSATSPFSNAGSYSYVRVSTGEQLPLPFAVSTGLSIWGEASIRP
jgi:hypothetical protein